MQTAEIVLEIIHERGKRGLPLDEIYRQLWNPRLYVRAYERLRTNAGALTPGVTEETVDGMSMAKIGKIIEAVRSETYRWKPARRVYIPKRSGKRRPLGIPVWSDKLLQEVMRQLLEAYYEPQFSDHSHGYRPNCGCHTALMTIWRLWNGSRWFIEGDISQCFDTLDHEILLRTMGEKIHDNRFLRLIRHMLKAGYLENWKWNATHSGSPQGGVISPILSNIYLDRLDKYVEKTLLPKYNRGDKHAADPEYQGLTRQIATARRRGDRQRVKTLTLQRRAMPSKLTDDPGYRRLRYVRYADDFLLGFIGPKAEAEEIKDELRKFLSNVLKLELTEDKTLITHAKSEAARFLSYEIRNQQSNDKLDRTGTRNVNGRIGLYVPQDVIDRKRLEYMRDGKPIHRVDILNASDYSIVTTYQHEYRGVVQYYKLAHNIAHLSAVRTVMHDSLLKTLANKHKARVTQIAARHKATTQTEHGPMRVLRVVVPRGEEKEPLVATFGGIPLRRQKDAVLQDRQYQIHPIRTDLVKRWFADVCELCGSKGDCEVHHIRKLANLHKPGRREKPEWMKRMIALNRKTLVVCKPCHQAITHGRPVNVDRSLESRVH